MPARGTRAGRGQAKALAGVALGGDAYPGDLVRWAAELPEPGHELCLPLRHAVLGRLVLVLLAKRRTRLTGQEHQRHKSPRLVDLVVWITANFLVAA
jgi:hypothetical protein